VDALVEGDFDLEFVVFCEALLFAGDRIVNVEKPSVNIGSSGGTNFLDIILPITISPYKRLLTVYRASKSNDGSPLGCRMPHCFTTLLGEAGW
jgi:hypothetical protein